MPRQSASIGSKTFSTSAARVRVALGHDAAVVGDLDLGAALFELLEDHVDALQHVDRLEAGDDAGHVVLLGEEPVRLAGR